MSETTLGSFGKFIRGKGIPKSHITNGDGLPCIRYADIYTSYDEITDRFQSQVSAENAKEALAVQEGDILFPTSGETAEEIGKALAYLGKETAYAGGDTLILREHSQNAAYLAYALNEWQAVKQKARLATGQSIVHLYASELSQVKIWLPPLAEQERIVKILSAADAAIATAGKARLASQGRLAALQAHLIFNASFQREKLKGYLEQKSERKGDNAFNTVLSVTNEHGFVLADEKFGHRVASSDVSNYKIVKRGDFAYNPSRLNVGSIARLEDWEAGLVSPMYVVLKTNETKLLPDFFRHWLQTAEANQRIRRAVQGSVRESVGFNDICSLPIPLPGLNEQAAICGALGELENERATFGELIIALKKQKRGLMQQLLTGKLRVPEKQRAKNGAEE